MKYILSVARVNDDIPEDHFISGDSHDEAKQKALDMAIGRGWLVRRCKWSEWFMQGARYPWLPPMEESVYWNISADRNKLRTFMTLKPWRTPDEKTEPPMPVEMLSTGDDGVVVSHMGTDLQYRIKEVTFRDNPDKDSAWPVLPDKVVIYLPHLDNSTIHANFDDIKVVSDKSSVAYVVAMQNLRRENTK